jgi:hypothetical protein
MTFTASAGGNGASAAPVDWKDATLPRSSRPPADADDRPRSPRQVRHVDDEDEYDDRPSRRRPRDRRYLTPHRGTLILILGILALIPVHGMALTLVLGPIAWIMGNNDLKEMRAGRMDPEGESQTSTGRICGMIATILGLIGVVVALFFLCLWFAVFVGIMGAAASH